MKQAPRARPPPPQIQPRPPNLRPGRPPTPPGPPPPPETKRKKEHGEITFVFATRARAHTHAHLPSRLPSWPGQPSPGVALTPLHLLKTYRKPLRTPLGVPCSYLAPRLPGQFTHKQLNRAPTSHLQKCVFSLKIQMLNLTPPPLATRNPAPSLAVFVHTGAQLRGSPKEARETEVVLAGSFPLSLPESRFCPVLSVQNEGWRRAGGRRTASPRAHNRTHAPHTRQAPVPARSPSRLSAAWRSPVAWASAPCHQGESSGARRRPLAQLAQPRWTLKRKSPSTRHPMLAPRESRGSGRKAQGQRDPGSGPKLTRRCVRCCRRWRTRRRCRRRLRAGLARAGRSAARAPRTAPLRLLLSADQG